MNKEEINIIKEQLYLENGKRVSYIDIDFEEAEEFINAIENVLNYIDKLQKKLDNSISKDKIKEALGDKNMPDEMILTYIETLVSENSRLEDIEDRKVQIEYNNVFNKGVKSVEDKIRDKIKELEEILEYAITEEGMAEIDRVEYEDTETKIEVLKELLGDDE